MHETSRSRLGLTRTKQQNKILLDLKEKEIEVANREIEELRVMNKGTLRVIQ